jgi:hypothetical protein
MTVTMRRFGRYATLQDHECPQDGARIVRKLERRVDRSCAIAEQVKGFLERGNRFFVLGQPSVEFQRCRVHVTTTSPEAPCTITVSYGF